MNYRVTAKGGLNIRSGPGKEYEDLGDLQFGQVVISPDTSKFIPILLEDNTIGWAAKEFVQEAPEDLQEIEAVEISVKEIPPLPIFQKDLISTFGYPQERAGYLTTIDLREFAGHLGHVRDFQGNPWSCRIYGHEIMARPLKKAFGFICERGLAGELKTYDGCFNIRKMSSGKSYSVHSWGLAVDFNASQNPYGGEVTFSDDLIICFAEAGFEAGALWNTPDGMHFQLPWIRDWRELKDPLGPKV